MKRRATAGGGAGMRVRRSLVIVTAALLVPTLLAIAPVADAAPSTGRSVGAAPGAPPVPTGPEALPALPRSSAYARQIFLALINREPSSSEVRVVGTLLDSGAPTVSVVNLLSRSDAHLGPRIDQLYRQLLDRRANRENERFWAARIRDRGFSLEHVVAELVSSSEFFRLAGGTDAGFVRLAYRTLLGRPPDGTGLRYWVAQLGAGVTRGAVAGALIHTAGYATPLVQTLFRQLLDRPADGSGLTHWVTGFVAHRAGELDIVAGLLSSREAADRGCDFLVGRGCLLPFPNDFFTAPDPTTATGRRVDFKQSFMPANSSGVHMDPTEWNRNDGFSPGQAILVHVPTIDLTRTGAAPLTDIARSLQASAPIAVVDANTGERQPVFTELDANIPAGHRRADQLLYIRPARNWVEGHRYIVVLRNLRDSAGALLHAPDAFRRYRDGLPSAIGGFEQRRPHMETLFTELGRAGISRTNLYLSWDFTVASTNNVSGRMRFIRDDAFARLGPHAPAFTITTVDTNPDPGVARRVQGTFAVPLYLTGNGAPGNRFDTGANGLPQVNGTYTAHFTCIVPTVALANPARPVVYGHGLFGDSGEVNAGNVRAMAVDHDMVECGTEWLGLSGEDLPNAANILQDLSRFPTLGDRAQQGILDTLFLARLLHRADGLASASAFHNATGRPVIDPTNVFYDGNSQGGVVGGAFVAMSPDISHGVLGVPGMNYSTLLERSVDFDPFQALYRANYLDPVERVIGIGLIQMLWDRGETDGYAAHMTTDPLPGTGPHEVLLHVAVGDHQVATLTAEVEARTAGLSVHAPPYAPGRSRDVTPAWGIPPITSYPFDGSALVIWDSGAALPPLTNVPPRAGFDPHEDPRNDPDAQQQKSDFLKPGGVVTDVCGPQACPADHS